jgi:hypothetical protein
MRIYSVVLVNDMILAMAGRRDQDHVTATTFLGVATLTRQSEALLTPEIVRRLWKRNQTI